MRGDVGVLPTPRVAAFIRLAKPHRWLHRLQDMAPRAASVAAILVVAIVSLAASCASESGSSTGTDPDRSTGPTGAEDLDFTADIVVMESFPVQLRGSLTVVNPTKRTIAFEVGGCPVFLRAYGSANGGPVWDQANGAVCTMILRTVTLEPGEVEVFQTATAGAGEILGNDLPDGTYRTAVYLAFASGGEREVETGEVQLAIPR